MLSKADTAYPQLKSKLTKRDLKLCYTPTIEELKFCHSRTRGKDSLLGFVVLLKAQYQNKIFQKSTWIKEVYINSPLLSIWDSDMYFYQAE